MAEIRVNLDPLRVTDEEKAVLANIAARQAEAENEEIAKNLPSLDDVADGLTLGRYHARPVSVGIIAILEKIGSPIVVGERDPKFDDMIIALFLLLSDDDELELVRYARNGELAERAEAWAFSIPLAELRELTDQVAAQFSGIADAMKIYGGGGESDGNPQTGSSTAPTPSCRNMGGVGGTACGKSRSGSRSNTSAPSRKGTPEKTR